MPEGLRPGLRALIRLDPAQHTAVVEAASEIRPTLRRDDFTNQLASRLHGFSEAEVEQIADGLLGLVAGQIASDKSGEDFARSVALFGELAVPADQVENVAHRLVEYLSCESLSVAAKALDIQSEQLATYGDARILTDIRPIFSADAKVKPGSALVTHALRISYFTSRRREDFFVAMDNDDLDDLQEALNRARDKAATLSQFLREANMGEVQASMSEAKDGPTT